jgi:FecR protein
MKLALFLAALMLASSVQAEIGSVTESSGVAIIKRGKDTITVSKGTLVEMNDKVETKNGKVKITFKDNTTVNVTESSALVIDDFVYDPKSGAGKLNLKAAAGTVRYASGNIAHNNPNAVNIKTPTAAIAVRGTDFVMAVNETGASMIMLMPTCEIEGNVNLKGLTCGSGAIDVETPAGIVKMNRPYQATLVETAANPPSPPVTVALNGMAIGNNLMINPPRTMAGQNIIMAARDAANKTGDMKKDDKDRRNEKDEKDNEKQHQVANKEQSILDKDKSSNNEDADRLAKLKPPEDLVADKVGNREASSEDEHVFKLFKDKSQTQQIGWQWEGLSQNGRNYTNVVLPMDTKVQVVVSQDMQVNSWIFATGGRAQGTITVVQNYR